MENYAECSVQQFSRCTDTPAPGVGEEESGMTAECSRCVSRQEAPLTTGKDLGVPSCPGGQPFPFADEEVQVSRR